MDTKKPLEEPQLEPNNIFDVIGSYGPWQRIVYMIFFFVNIVGIWQNLSITFLAPNMDYWCVDPPSHIVNATVSRNYSHYLVDQCEIPAHLISNSTEGTVSCTKWEYDTSYYSQTIVSQWDLVCGREWLVSLAKSIYMVGFLVSVIFFGQLSDCIGRFPTIVISYVITFVSLWLSLLSTSYLMFVILRFFQAFGRTGLTTTGFVLVMEMVGPQHRSKIGITIQLGWAVGFVSLAGVAWIFRHWFWFQLAMSVPVVPLVFAYKIIPESPRWLLMQGKKDKLIKLLNKAASKNKRDLKYDINDLEFLKKSEKTEEDKNRKTVIHLFKTPKMRYRTFNMIYLWIVNAFMYYGLSYNTNDLAGDHYLNFFFSGLMEFPSYAVVYFAIEKYGRRPTLIGLMLIGGTACAAMIPVPAALPWLTTTFAMIGKFCITGSFGILYLYTNELFPTVVRNVAIGTCSMWARIGSILAPFVKELGKATHPSVPNIIYAVLAVSSGLLAFLLPETKGRKIPDTIEEGENFGDKLSAEENENESKKAP